MAETRTGANKATSFPCGGSAEKVFQSHKADCTNGSRGVRCDTNKGPVNEVSRQTLANGKQVTMRDAYGRTWAMRVVNESDGKWLRWNSPYSSGRTPD